MPKLCAVLGIAPQREDLRACNCRASCSLEFGVMRGSAAKALHCNAVGEPYPDRPQRGLGPWVSRQARSQACLHTATVTQPCRMSTGAVSLLTSR